MLKVTWNEETCQHSGVCVTQLPQVFKIEKGQFVIDTTGADADRIRKVCDDCPSGALRAEEQ
ncbi:MAG: (4Fe-4S)-binding protein [Chromatiaceae bacterium]|jgi:uncharacterized Fe-S cluster protein YjdI